MLYTIDYSNMDYSTSHLYYALSHDQDISAPISKILREHVPPWNPGPDVEELVLVCVFAFNEDKQTNIQLLWLNSHHTNLIV